MRVVRLLGALCLVLSHTVGSVAAQERIAVLSETGTPVIATEVLLAVGPADEPAGGAGLAYLAARSVLAHVRPSLDSLGARASLTANKDALSFSVIAAPEAWEEVVERLVTGILQQTPDSLTVLRERRAIASELRGRLANPADAATRELDRAFFGVDHPWGRPTVGTPESIERLSFAQVDAFLTDHFTAERTYAAVVGPVEGPEARGHLRPLLGSAAPAPVATVAFRPAVLPVRRDYNSITSWISASYRFSEVVDEEALRFVVFLATEALSPSPARRSVYTLHTEVVPRVGGGEIRLQLVVPPEEALEWAERVEDAVARLATTTLQDDIFRGHVRRFRGERVMQLLTPEARAYEAARRLLVDGRAGELLPDHDEITQERMRAAARTLGTPTLVILGPLLD